MRSGTRLLCIVLGCAVWLSADSVQSQDWPQWRGPNRDAKATGFQAPATWPTDLTKKWQITVGQGDATPALVGDKLYVFTLQDGNEVIRCLEADSGKELWQDKYETQGATGASSPHAGPRSSPTVAEGKVITFGVRGILSCVDAATGAKVWRKDDFEGAWPRFFTASSPIVVNGMCVAQVGGDSKGGIVAYDLATGDVKWQWTDEGSAYASPALLSVGTDKVVVAVTDKSVVGIGAADGKLLWKTPFEVRRGGYNAATPIVDGSTIIYAGSGRGTTAVSLEKPGSELAAKELWKNADNSVQFNTPVLRDGLIFGLSDRNNLFCIRAQDGQTAWSATLGSGGSGRARGFGSIVDAGSVLMALTPSGQLVVFEPSDKEFKQLASYKVADSATYAYPVVAGNRLFIKDQDSVALWTIE